MANLTTSATCILVIGATSGIGKDLALALHELPSTPTVIIAGRRQSRLDEILSHGSKAGKDKLYAINVDVSGGTAELEQFTKVTLAKFPDLDAIIFAAGVQHVVKFRAPETIKLDVLQNEVLTNYTSVLALTTLFLPHLLNLDKPSFIIPITSGLAFSPAPMVPGYCATKAALHSLCISLRSQLRDTKIKVIEIAPPLVESELHDHQGSTPALSKIWMPLSTFTPLVLEALERGDENIPIGMAAQAFNKYESGKQEASDTMYKLMAN